MASYEISPGRVGGVPLARPVELACFALIVAHAVYLAASYWQGSWLVAPDGNGLPADFLNVWPPPEPCTISVFRSAEAASFILLPLVAPRGTPLPLR